MFQEGDLKRIISLLTFGLLLLLFVMLSALTLHQQFLGSVHSAPEDTLMLLGAQYDLIDADVYVDQHDNVAIILRNNEPGQFPELIFVMREMYGRATVITGFNYLEFND